MIYQGQVHTKNGFKPVAAPPPKRCQQLNSTLTKFVYSSV